MLGWKFGNLQFFVMWILMRFLYRYWRRLKDRRKKEGTCSFQFACCFYQCHFTLVLLHRAWAVLSNFQHILVLPEPFSSPTPPSRGLTRTRLTSSSTRSLLWTNTIPTTTGDAVSWESYIPGSVGLLFWAPEILSSTPCSEVWLIVHKTPPAHVWGTRAADWHFLFIYLIPNSPWIPLVVSRFWKPQTFLTSKGNTHVLVYYLPRLFLLILLFKCFSISSINFLY